VNGRIVRRLDRMAHSRGCLGHQGRGRNVRDPGLAGVDCAGVDGAELCTAGGRGLLRVRSAVAHRSAAGRAARLSGIAIGSIVFAIMLALMVVRVPIGISMFAVGAGGYVYLTGGNVATLLNSLKNLAYARLSNYD